jgi:hypothetical protein
VNKASMAAVIAVRVVVAEAAATIAAMVAAAKDAVECGGDVPAGVARYAGFALTNR